MRDGSFTQHYLPKEAASFVSSPGPEVMGHTSIGMIPPLSGDH